MKRIPLKWLLFLIFSAAGVVLWFFLLRDSHVPRVIPGSPEEISAPTMRILSRPIPQFREATGVVRASQEAVLSGKVAGLVESVSVREGDRVRKGGLLVRLDNRDLLANLQKAEAELENAEIHLNRMKDLFRDESVAKQELDNAERHFKVAAAAKKTIEVNLSFTVIRAPFGGVITEKAIEVGELVTPGRPLLRLEDDRNLRLEATVAAADIQMIKKGDAVRVTLDALGGQPVEGHISQILPAADPATHTFLVKAALPPVPGLRTGLFGRMAFTVGSRTGLAVPEAAVKKRGALSLIYVLNPEDRLETRLVKTGTEGDGLIEILSGLAPGERILSNASLGKEGAVVRPIPKEDP